MSGDCRSWLGDCPASRACRDEGGETQYRHAHAQTTTHCFWSPSRTVLSSFALSSKDFCSSRLSIGDDLSWGRGDAAGNRHSLFLQRLDTLFLCDKILGLFVGGLPCLLELIGKRSFPRDTSISQAVCLVKRCGHSLLLQVLQPDIAIVDRSLLILDSVCSRSMAVSWFRSRL